MSDMFLMCVRTVDHMPQNNFQEPILSIHGGFRIQIQVFRFVSKRFYLLSYLCTFSSKIFFLMVLMDPSTWASYIPGSFLLP